MGFGGCLTTGQIWLAGGEGAAGPDEAGAALCLGDLEAAGAQSMGSESLTPSMQACSEQGKKRMQQQTWRDARLRERGYGVKQGVSGGRNPAVETC